ncbi:MAG: DNA polymerase/3'-5' exonuclease PolX [Opitutaceae bacterium]|nr:DNA polymerase/3'-5' exonuclease PolX [Opitutaceae bacterium]
MNKTEIAAVLNDIAMLLELKGDNPFKIRAYQAGARVVESLSEEELTRRIDAGTLEEIKGIGEALAGKIGELHRSGKLDFYEKLRGSIPESLRELLQISGLGPKKIRALHGQLGVTSVADLVKACTDGRVAELAGFGEKSQEKILAAIHHREAYARRHLWLSAWEEAEPLLAGLRGLPQVEQAEVCGSFRRRMETVGDLDFLVATLEPRPVVEWFVTRPVVQEITAQGETKASVRLQSGLQADLRLVSPAQFPFTLHHLTGSKDHNVQMRQRALARGWSMSEWGLSPVEQAVAMRQEEGGRRAHEQTRAIRDEAGLFAQLGLAYIPPELREGLGEIELAEKSALPRLVEEADIRGVFHNHTTWSDGHNTLAEMAAAAEAFGWEYLGIADHSAASVQAQGLDEKRLHEQIAEIRALNLAQKFNTYLFAGTECDIRPDGRLDYGDELLAELDYVVISVHSALQQNREDMTRRIVRGIEHPAATMLGHLTGRLLLEREGCDVDVDRVIDAAIANGVVMELNANPWRLDMDWRHWRKAAEKGLICCINPDAHTAAGLAHFRLGVGTARKGWLTKNSILNTRSLAEVKRWLEQRRAGAVHGGIAAGRPEQSTNGKLHK